MIRDAVDIVASFIKLFSNPQTQFEALTLVFAGLLLGYFARRLYAGPSNRKLRSDLKKYEAQLVGFNKLRDALNGEEDELWKLYNAEPPADFSDRMSENKPKIITVINLKGGVGKTTTVANLAAHFDHMGKRVLAIDLDYQGSLTRMMLLAIKARLPKDRLFLISLSRMPSPAP